MSVLNRAMTLFLRNNRNQSVLDLELTAESGRVKDLHAVVCIQPYSELLLMNLHRSAEIIEDFDQLSSLRGWYWEGQIKASSSFTVVHGLLKNRLFEIAAKYNLHYVED